MGIAEYVLAFVVAVLAIGRLTRLIYFDDFPPSEWIRRSWDWVTRVDPDTPRDSREGWNKLLYCPYCLSFYVGVAVVSWALLSDFHWSWWAVMSTVAASYLAAIIVASDWG